MIHAKCGRAKTAGPVPLPGKLIPLEALRGCAAIIVVLSHVVLAFQPKYVGVTPSVDPAADLIGSPLFVLLNGTGMVIIFFVLSGYVLAQRGLRANAGLALLDAATKRWFRLTPLILISVLLSWALFHLHLYAFESAARFSRSDWLAHFSYGGFSQSDLPSLWFTIRQGLWGCLVNGEMSLDSSLWTMCYEFAGSFMVFGLALLLRPGWRRIMPPILVLLAVWLLMNRPWLFPFVLGCAACLLPLRGYRLPAWMTWSLVIVGVYLVGFAMAVTGPTPFTPVGAYRWVAMLTPGHLADPWITPMVAVCGTGALALLCVCASENPVSRLLSGRIAGWIGAASFPLYVVHVLIIDSVASWAYAGVGGSWTGTILATVVLVAVLVPVAYVLTRFDQWWLRALRRFSIMNLFGRMLPPAAGQSVNQIKR